MIKVNNVSRTYAKRGQQVNAIANVSLEIQSGEFVSIIGPSGSGKSTLLLMLGGMLSPSQGQICIDGQSLYDLSPGQRSDLRRQKMGFVFQTFHLVPYLTAQQNVQVPLLLAGIAPKEQISLAQHLLERVGLADRLDHTPAELSVGQQQRVALARMLANDPAIIFADEPTGNLDPDMSRQVMDFLITLNKEGKTVIIVTHDMKIAKQATRTLSISTGGVLV